LFDSLFSPFWLSARKQTLQLGRVIGCSVLHNSCFCHNPISDEVAYAAGSAIVIYDCKQNKQVSLLVNTPAVAKAITCLSWSADGKYLASGESGHQPSITIWDVASKQVLIELKQHKFGIGCLSFSANSRYLASVGFQDDAFVYVWDLVGLDSATAAAASIATTPAAANKVQTKVRNNCAPSVCVSSFFCSPIIRLMT
jgi:WD40 repeat protein